MIDSNFHPGVVAATSSVTCVWPSGTHVSVRSGISVISSTLLSLHPHLYLHLPQSQIHSPMLRSTQLQLRSPLQHLLQMVGPMYQSSHFLRSTILDGLTPSTRPLQCWPHLSNLSQSRPSKTATTTTTTTTTTVGAVRRRTDSRPMSTTSSDTTEAWTGTRPATCVVMKTAGPSAAPSVISKSAGIASSIASECCVGRC
jgi:hypothetical protein